MVEMGEQVECALHKRTPFCRPKRSAANSPTARAYQTEDPPDEE